MYSQNSEEAHILRIVGDQTGRFLDIGAYNPFKFSNTRALFERGWSGVMVEPSPGPFLDLLTEYGSSDRIILVSAAIAKLPTLINFHWSEDAISTSVESHYQKWRDRAKYEGSFFMRAITLAELICRVGPDFDFVSIDAEGESSNIFLDALELRMRPKCFCVEHDGRQKELSYAAVRAGYCMEHVNGENVIFARQESHDNM